MRFISRHKDTQVVIHHDEQAFRMLPGGTVTAEQVKPALVISFDHEEMLPTYERMYALQVFMSGDTRPFGAMPDFQSQPIVDAMGRVVDLTDEYRPDFHFGIFDTVTMCAPHEREEVEQFLLNSKAYGKDYILVEQQRVIPPWPNYDVCDLSTAVNMLKHGGFDLMRTLEYESAHENREDWLTEIGKLLTEKSISKAQNDSLSVTIE
jgi:hypothetical protein